MKNVEISNIFMYNLCDVYGVFNIKGNDMIKDILFALELGVKVIGSFLICIYLGIQLDKFFLSEPTFILIFIFIAFIYVMKTLLGEIWK